MTLYLIDKYEAKLKENNVATGLKIYGTKVRIALIGLIVVLCIAVLSFIVCSFAGSKILDADNENIQIASENTQDTVAPENGNVVSDDENNQMVEEAEQNLLNKESDYTNEINRRDKASAFKWWYGSSFGAMLVAVIAILIITKMAGKKASREIEKNLHQRFEMLANVIYTMYYSENKKKNAVGLKDKIDSIKIKELIDIYDDSIKKIEEDEKRRNKVLIGFLSVIGTCITTSLAEINNLSISINEWLVLVEILIVIAFLFSVPIYFCNEINPTKEKYKSMLMLLKQLLVYVVSDDRGIIEGDTKSEAVNVQKKGKVNEPKKR